MAFLGISQRFGAAHDSAIDDLSGLFQYMAVLSSTECSPLAAVICQVLELNSEARGWPWLVLSPRLSGLTRVCSHLFW